MLNVFISKPELILSRHEKANLKKGKKKPTDFDTQAYIPSTFSKIIIIIVLKNMIDLCAKKADVTAFKRTY